MTRTVARSALAASFGWLVQNTIAETQPAVECGPDGDCEAATEEEGALKVSLLQHRGAAAAAAARGAGEEVAGEVEEAANMDQEHARKHYELLAELNAVDEELAMIELKCGPPSASCVGAINWAKHTGIRQHPNWYPGLHSYSPNDAFQKHLADGGHGGCQQPCGQGGEGHENHVDEHQQVNSSAKLEPFLGIGYTPDPNRRAASPICDDFMADWSEPIWGPSGRNDLQTIKDMGANAVRTYGIGSHLSHKAFLDHAHKVGLKVMPGFADYPYLHLGSSCKIQDVARYLPTNCIRGGKDHNCAHIIKTHYLEMLKNGYTVVGEDGKRRYHPAISTITLINECELKLMYNNGERLGQDANHAKVVVSATDGLISAEKELGIVGDLPMLTATASYAACRDCKSVRQRFGGLNERTPFLPFVYDYYLAFQNPQSYVHYYPKNNLTEMYANRWVNSFNTPRPAASLCEAENQALKMYTAGPLGKVPIYIGEFHHHSLSPEQFGADISKAKAIVENKDSGSCGKKENPLAGFNLFEFQVSYWKGVGSEGGTGTKYGMWGLGQPVRWGLKTHADNNAIGYRTYDVPCIYPAIMGGRRANSWEKTNVGEVLKVLGGKLPPKPILC